MKEYILCAAIWYKDFQLKTPIDSNTLPVNCDKGMVFCGYRHIQCMRSMTSISGIWAKKDLIGEYEQGFLTSKNRFVDRIEGAKIAFDANQINSQIHVLYSEDLY